MRGVKTISQTVHNGHQANHSDLPIREESVIRALSDEVGEDMIPFLVERFRSDLVTHLAEVNNALEKKDAHLLERESHTLKSVSGTFGARRLQHLMKEINESCRMGDHSRAIDLATSASDLGRETLAAYDPQ